MHNMDDFWQPTMDMEDVKEKLVYFYDGNVEGLLDVLDMDLRTLLNKLEDEIDCHRDSFPWLETAPEGWEDD